MPPETDTDTDAASGTPVPPAPPFRPTLPLAPPRPPVASDPQATGAAANETVAAALQAAAAQSARYLPPPVLKAPIKRKKTFWEGMFLFWLFRMGLAGVVAAGLAGYRWYEQRDREPARPETWDERVLDHVDFVEDERGLTFDHPVAIDFMPEDDFVALFALEELDDEERSAADEAAADAADVVDAAGLSATYDPQADDATLSQVSILGFYDPSSDRITLRGDELTPAVEAVLVHELTHALQAQWFDVQTGGPDDLQVRAIYEADAMRIEDAYVETMSAADQDQVYGENFSTADSDSALSSVPWAMIDQSQAPYTLGRLFLQYVVESRGAQAVDAVFDDIPSSEELVNPSLYGTQAAVPMAGGTLPTDAILIDDAVEWSYYDALLMLDAWLPWTDTRAALDGWSTASITTFTRGDYGGPVCFGTRTQFDTPEQAAHFGGAVTAWAVAAGSAAAPVTTANEVTFEACPRPDGAIDPPAPVHPTSEAVWVESILVTELTPAGATPDPWSVCVARALVDDASFADFAWLDEITPEQDAAITLAVDTAKWLCGPAPF